MIGSISNYLFASYLKKIQLKVLRSDWKLNIWLFWCKSIRNHYFYIKVTIKDSIDQSSDAKYWSSYQLARYSTM